MKSIVHIVPQLPPQNSGVGDYAALVGRGMEELEGGVACGYVAAGCNVQQLPEDGPRVRNITGRCDGASLWRAVGEVGAGGGELGAGSPEHQIGSVAVVLHYSGYGYERNGCPAWLVDALRSRPAWVDRVVTYFHELYATGQPWQRAFWYSSRQRRIAADIGSLSDAILTNLEQSARWLEQVTGRVSGTVKNLPIPSNVGEPEKLSSFNERPQRAVTFGGERRKRFALYDDAERVVQLLRQWGIRELVDIGGPCSIKRRAFEKARIDVTALGYLGATELSAELCQCRVGFTDYSFARVAKSGVFAAYAAHGVVPILRVSCEDPADGVGAGPEALALGPAANLRCWRETLPQISIASRHWYRNNSSVRHAGSILQLVSSSFAGIESALRTTLK